MEKVQRLVERRRAQVGRAERSRKPKQETSYRLLEEDDDIVCSIDEVTSNNG